MGGKLRPSSWGPTFTSLSEPEYAWYFLGNMAFFMAMQMQFILRGFLAYDLTDSAASLGIIAISISVPMLFAAPVGGVIADRVNKRTLLIVTHLSAAAASLLVSILIIAGWLEFWHLVVISLATGTVFSFNMPARQALVPQLVPQHKLMNAISLQMGGMNLTRIIAPALGGLLIAPLGAGWVYMITTVLFTVAALSELHLPKHGMKPEGPPKSFREDFAGGFQYIARHRMIALLITTGMLIPLFGFPVQQILPVFAEDVFDKGPSGLGVLAAMSGVGGLIGAIISANMDSQPHKGRLMLAGGLFMGTFLLAFAVTPFFGLALIFLALGNVGQMVFNTTNNTAIQANLPPEVRGRVMSVTMMSFGLMPLGVLPLMAAADSIGAQAAVAISSCVLIATMIVLFSLNSTLRGLRLDKAARSSLSPVRAAQLVADGKLTQDEADRLLRGEHPTREQAIAIAHTEREPVGAPSAR
jgi:MFS family permease